MSPEGTSLAPAAALARLREGNKRFVVGDTNLTAKVWRPGLSDGQEPFAAVLGCSDSRAPAELVFDQGLGDLFVIRVAGNVVAPSGIGSVEFAVDRFGTRLVVVLGHSLCGAVQATIRAIEERNSPASPRLRSITDRIRPHLEELVTLGKGDRDAVLTHAVRANVRASVVQLSHGSALLEEYVRSGRIAVVGAVMDLATGEVDFCEVPPLSP
jgi:carbonic anhydrase